MRRGLRLGVRRGVGLDEGHELSPTMSTLNEGQKRGRVGERGARGIREMGGGVRGSIALVADVGDVPRPYSVGAIPPKVATMAAAGAHSDRFQKSYSENSQFQLNRVMNSRLCYYYKNSVHRYSSVPNRCVGQNKRAGGKFLKNIIRADKISPCYLPNSLQPLSYLGFTPGPRIMRFLGLGKSCIK